MSSSDPSSNNCITEDDLLDLLRQHARICGNSDDSLLLNIYLGAAKSYLLSQYNVYVAPEVVYDEVLIAHNAYGYKHYGYKHYLYKRYAYEVSTVTVNDVEVSHTYNSRLQYVAIPNLQVQDNTVVITYNVGYTDCLPENIVQSLMMLATYYYDNRSNNALLVPQAIPDNIRQLLPYNLVTSL